MLCQEIYAEILNQFLFIRFCIFKRQIVKATNDVHLFEVKFKQLYSKSDHRSRTLSDRHYYFIYAPNVYHYATLQNQVPETGISVSRFALQIRPGFYWAIAYFGSIQYLSE